MTPQPDWRGLAEQASRETDPDKLLALVDELNRTLADPYKRKPRHSKLVSGKIKDGKPGLTGHGHSASRYR